MFHKLLRGLHDAFPGEEMYLPDPLFQLVTKWMIAQGHIRGGKQVKYRGKLVLAYDEDAVQKAYHLTPIHIPKRIMEKATIMEFSLGENLCEPDEPEEKGPDPTTGGGLGIKLDTNWRRQL
ncbi:MAG: hypothetical protein ACXABY_17980 [Candidatus Thorarchaeota archaeon]|jgi:hypothetical protein